MNKLYLLLSIVGFIAPNILVTKVSVETGNVLLWLHPMETITSMFANNIAGAFIIDLLVVVLVFMIWTWGEAKKHGIKHVPLLWVLTFLFGLAGPFPLFLYMRGKKMG